MVRFLFWELYNEAMPHYDRDKEKWLGGDFRKLIKAIRDGHPMINDPEVRKLIAGQLEEPKSPSTRTRSRDGWPYAREVMCEVRNGVSEYRARKIVLDRHPHLNDETLKGYCRHYKSALLENQKINEENQ